jgi:hypothetical protein
VPIKESVLKSSFDGMSINNLGFSYCDHCGAEFRLFSIFNRDMQGLCKVWKRRHERACKNRTSEQRLKWAKPYIGKDRYEGSIVVDVNHPGFCSKNCHAHESAESWFDELLGIAVSHDNLDAIRDFEGWTDGWEDRNPADVYYAEFPEHSPKP